MAIEIPLYNFRGQRSSLFTGRPQGEQARSELDLDSKDMSSDVYEFVIPKGTTSFNPSFYLGLLYKSIKTLGVSGFQEKYRFVFEDDSDKVKKVIKNNLDDGLRNAINSMNSKNNLFNFLK